MGITLMENKHLEIYRDITDDVIESDFVPYACLINPHTVLTKNGELLQTIKITGFTYEAISNSEADLRAVIRDAITDCIDTNDYAIWIHTFRRKKKLSPDGDYPDEFSKYVHEQWKERNSWDKKYINELYVTIARECQSADIVSLTSFFEGLIPQVDRRIRNNYLDAIAIELDTVADAVLHTLQEFGAKRLSMVKRGDGIYYSEQIEFLEKLINLQERPMPVEEIDLSHYLTSGEITFGFNAMEVRTAEGERRFGSILTLKEYKEASLYSLDNFLQLPCEFIITQCIDFINAGKALAEYEKQKYYLSVSGETKLMEQCELNRILENNKNRITDYGEQQTMIFVIADNIRELETNLRKVREELSKLGIIALREDLKFEECYWAQLPANFEFLSRLSYIDTKHVGGFANIQNYPAGNVKGNPWGPPVTVFYTAAGTPYFFNFHLGTCGHTSVVGPHGSGKSVLINFLISEARKFNHRLFYLDAHGSAETFIRSIGGHYYDLANPESDHSLSPLSLPDKKTNREFLTLWLTTLLDPTGKMVDANMRSYFVSIIDYLYTLPQEERTLQNIAEHIRTARPDIADRLSPWHSDGERAFYFDHASESVQPKNGIIGFNVNALIDHPSLLVPVTSYLIHRITMTMDGTPAILFLDEAWRILNTPLFAPRVKAWMQYLTAKNALGIFATELVEQTAEYNFSKEIITNVSTQIYMPDEDPDNAYQDIFGLDDEEFAYLDIMNTEYRHFLLKRANETIVAELNLGGMDDIVDILSGEPANDDDDDTEEEMEQVS